MVQLETNLNEIIIQSNYSDVYYRKTLENVVCKMAEIWSRPNIFQVLSACSPFLCESTSSSHDITADQGVNTCLIFNYIYAMVYCNIISKHSAITATEI